MTSHGEWKQLLHRLRQLAHDWQHVQLIIEDDSDQSEQWLGFRVIDCQPESARKALDQAIRQATDLIKQDVFAISSASKGDVTVD